MAALRRMFDLTLEGTWTFDSLFQLLLDVAELHVDGAVAWDHAPPDTSVVLPERRRRATSAAGVVRLSVTEDTDEEFWPGLDGPHQGLGTFIADLRWTRPDGRIPRPSARGKAPDAPPRTLRVSPLEAPFTDLDRVRAALESAGARLCPTVADCVQNARFALHLGDPARALAFIEEAPPPLPATPSSLFEGRPDPLAPLRAKARRALDE